GLWHVGPQLTPREVLHLSGPSGPVQFDPAGNLLVAEIGRTVPAPPGAVRILRFARSRWQRALSDGLVLTTLDADLVSTGWDRAQRHCRCTALPPRDSPCSPPAPQGCAPSISPACSRARRCGGRSIQRQRSPRWSCPSMRAATPASPCTTRAGSRWPCSGRYS